MQQASKIVGKFFFRKPHVKSLSTHTVAYIEQCRSSNPHVGLKL